jgi:hypothetical protein
MDILSSVLMSVLLLSAALVLMFWHLRSWRSVQLDDLPPNEMDYYRRQYRRRMQTSALLGILAVAMVIGELLTRWVSSQLFIFIYWAATLVLVVWVALLAAVDIWATKYHFGELRQKYLIEQAKLHAEIRRVQSVRGNGKSMGKKQTEEGSLGK